MGDWRDGRDGRDGMVGRDGREVRDRRDGERQQRRESSFVLPTANATPQCADPKAESRKRCCDNKTSTH